MTCGERKLAGTAVEWKYEIRGISVKARNLCILASFITLPILI